MKFIMCFFVIFAVVIMPVQEASSMPDTSKVAIAKIDSNKTSSAVVSVDKEAFTIALNSANTTIEFLKWCLGTFLAIAAIIITAITAYFAWVSNQNKTKIKSVEAKLKSVEDRDKCR